MTTYRYAAVHENGRVHFETADAHGLRTGTHVRPGEVCAQANLVPELVAALASISLAEQESSTSAVDKVRDMGRTARTALANYRKATETT
jgi:hypothetical protein